MYRRRDRLHHAQALIRASAALFAVGLAGALPASADTARIATDGTVHRIDVVPFGAAGESGTALRYTRQKPGGGDTQSYVSGTDDLAIDRDPAIEINPATGLPVLVWSRDVGGQYAVVFSRFDGSVWSAPRLIAQSAGDAFEPQIKFGTNAMHLAWRQVAPSGANSLLRWSFDPTTLTTLYGPEPVPLDDPTALPPSGGTATAPAPCRADVYFAALLPGATPGGSGHAYVWGVRDEPVPITFHQAFLLPPGVDPLGPAGIGWLGGRFTLRFDSESQSRVYYTVRSDSGWSEMRTVETDASVSVGDAHLLIQDRNRMGP